MRATFPLATMITLVLAVGAARGQALPFHTDPSARDAVPNLGPVPAIRFLTTADFPPFNYRDESGELIGFNIDLARALCTELQISCTIQAWPWEQATDALADRQGDALIAGLAVTPENGERFDFSSTYLMLPGRFVARLPDTPDFAPERLEGRKVAVRQGSSHEDFLRRYLPSAQPIGFVSETDALDALQSGQVDAYFGDAMRASFWLNQHTDCCDFVGEPYFRTDAFGEGLAVALPAGQDAVRHAIDYGLVRLKESGRFDELYLRWFPVSFY